MSGPLTMTARVGYRWRVTFTVDPGGIDAGTVTALMMRWSPKVPRQLSAHEWADYRAGRNRFIAELGRLRVGRIAVVEPSLGRVHVIESAARWRTDRPRQRSDPKKAKSQRERSERRRTT